ncbi:hypothetical protein PsorP6_008909 [Peronosclerospora sorghi]|uniref:Uncharacterized protein n=1 Tax=Peronosclerospora sorghi TaxID=230839 RepID=A0ACC0W136_9STRA|nr:hypothetical protein PsorP6_008909 [Peronosclerospora sorghi]
MDPQQQHLVVTDSYVSVPTGEAFHSISASINTTTGMTIAEEEDVLHAVKPDPDPVSQALCALPSSEKWQQKRHVCDVVNCGKRFDSRWALISHLQTHSRDKPYKCTYADCTKSFKGKDYLEFHLKIHAEGNPYACDHPTCSKTFCSPKSLKKHIRLWHNPGGKSTSMEQQLRERIIKMATRNKEKTRKFESTIRTLMEENESLKRRILELESSQQRL